MQVFVSLGRCFFNSLYIYVIDDSDMKCFNLEIYSDLLYGLSLLIAGVKNR